MPCQLCRARTVRAEAANRSRRFSGSTLETPLGLELRGEHRKRYEQVRRRKPDEETPPDSEFCQPASPDPWEELDEMEMESAEWPDYWDDAGLDEFEIERNDPERFLPD